MQFHQTPSTSRFSMAFALWMVVSVLTVPLNFADDPPSPTDNPTPPAEGTPPAAIPTEPPPGEVQERGFSPKVLQPGLELKQVAPSVPPNPPAFGTLPGEFAIRSYLQNTPLTARDGGHR